MDLDRATGAFSGFRSTVSAAAVSFGLALSLASCAGTSESDVANQGLGSEPTDVGTLPGGLQVLPTGDAMYSIPIESPPGRAGLQPSLSIDYHSGRGNGMLGVGWGLSGAISVIERCGKNHRDHGEVSSPTNKDPSNWCLDGQVLYPTLEDDATYRLRPDIQTRVVQSEE